MKDVVIVSGCRTAIGAFGGSLRDLNGPVIAGVVMQEAIKRAGIDPALIDDIRFGCCLEHPDNLNVARVAALMAGLPENITAVTINRVCISAMEAVVSGMAMIQASMADVILAGGVEHMSGAPYAVYGARWGCRLQDHAFVDSLIHALHCGSHLMPHPEDGPVKSGMPLELFKGKPYIMGQTAELVAQLLNISREEMDEVALRSHNNTERATIQGDFKEEIVPIEVPQRKGPPKVFDKDEHYRPGLTMEQLAKLPPAFVPKIGKVTAGNSSGINDGSSAMIIMSAEKAKELGLAPIARIKAIGRGACHPSVMGLSPVPAVKDLLARNKGLGLKDFELIEVNEAFASQYIGCERELGLNREITNINGSGIGLGHPVGSTGCRIMVTLLYAMKKQGKTLGLATLCGGGGVSMACALEML
ncbi:MAG: acetyl-CoA C-acyltransferase [Deltaproteobacteria bacterium CG_4_8_14_3_um_filter_51_11]|nr:acetyl-CoA C-acyltransferase [bacterium]OIP38213.1 MAG: acetyl-CoA acetyltransferase [Desulfobacteraceae bacterium CG2_30_51_40]PIP48628.1 MAG: acetyl-CoA C-acyltransferase [Deltaproteobacteria bacterium CG23_combo_of_CG06-09_8_20_14_all_51_20]PIX19767.1 MAG: acetyl-CoA C-acyltransferase [Deltaproteobacteria bacterium CG_4_8_14_3_um_filter_51_11]PIY26200.1 MAG: acetyl-CoA C-acyltransferase [Deltaproteobacteria bacterium CG_4_10_14_3_um_filter_51_14]PJB35119.1 MAG: acetyl-CoA C-acyltransfera